jgi:hypothetical protein
MDLALSGALYNLTMDPYEKLAVTTGRDNYLLREFADFILGSVKSHTALPSEHCERESTEK